jgi:FkbM family methyltransferase
MKLINRWFVPVTEIDSIVLTDVELENWTCSEPINKSLKYVKKFDFAIDVGAWIGDSTSIISSKFKNVVGFEADPETFECCCKNLEKFNNITLYNIALSNTKDTKTLYRGASSFSSWISTSDEVLPISQKTVQTTTLDHYDFKNVDFIKIDIDSHEGFFLEGSIEFFKNNSPIVLIEYKPRVLKRQSSEMPDPLEFLLNIGYQIKEQVSTIDFVLSRE